MTDPTPAPPQLDLAALTMIAKNATQTDWTILPSQKTRGAHSIPGVARTICATSADVRHIATFDPPTVLALIARTEAAEAKIAAVRELHAASPCEPDCCLLETCNECLNAYPCPTIAALDTHTPETETTP